MSAEMPLANGLLAAVAEQLKVPLTNIARRAELGQAGELLLPADMATVGSQAMAALQLVDSYLLGLQLMEGQMHLMLEPVSISSLLTETAHSLERFAHDYKVDLEIQLAGRYEPVMAHRIGLKAALLSMGYTLVQAQAAAGHGKRGRLMLASHRTAHGITAGLYGDYEQLQAASWRRALQLHGRAHQPLSSLTVGNGAGVFVAEVILEAMDTRLRVGRHLKQSGLATILAPSRQLQLV